MYVFTFPEEDRRCSELSEQMVNAVSGVPLDIVLGPQLFFLYTSELFAILENKFRLCG